MFHEKKYELDELDKLDELDELDELDISNITSYIRSQLISLSPCIKSLEDVLFDLSTLINIKSLILNVIEPYLWLMGPALHDKS